MKLKNILESLKEVFAIVFLFTFLTSFVVSLNKIPSGSMIPTLQIQDHLLVSMLPFYYRVPTRGEIVVFERPNGEKWIKRVVGLPGEVIDIRNGEIYINDVYLDESSYLDERGISALNPIIESELTFPYIVPQDSYFLLGDNRLESYDCRYIGAIHKDEMIGKAIWRVYPLNRMGKIIA